MKERVRDCVNGVAGHGDVMKRVSERMCVGVCVKRGVFGRMRKPAALS